MLLVPRPRGATAERCSSSRAGPQSLRTDVTGFLQRDRAGHQKEGLLVPLGRILKQQRRRSRNLWPADGHICRARMALPPHATLSRALQPKMLFKPER